MPGGGRRLSPDASEFSQLKTLGEFDPWRQRLGMALVRFGTKQLAADAFELRGGRSGKDFDPRPVFGPPVRRPSKRAQWQVQVGGGDPTSG
jgi:hypothetical protein